MGVVIAHDHRNLAGRLRSLIRPRLFTACKVQVPVTAVNGTSDSMFTWIVLGSAACQFW